MQAIRLGLIGLGYIGKVHLRHSQKLSIGRLVAVADLSKAALAAASAAGIKKTYTRYEKLLEDPEVDAVIIALPTHLHLQCARKAAEAGKDIFLEKPIARNVAEAKEIISTVERNSVRLMIGYPLRFNMAFRNLREEVKKGVLGDVEVACASYISSGPFLHRAEGYQPIQVPDWWFNKELTGGGALIDLGSHIINFLRWCFGEVADIKSSLGHRFNMDFEDSAICLMKFNSKTTAVVNVGWFSQQYLLKAEFMGSVRHASAENAPVNPFSAAAQMLTTGVSRFYWPHHAELQYFVQCLIRDLPPSPSGQEGLKDLEAITGAYENEISKPDLRG